jgi:hypothetical protein
LQAHASDFSVAQFEAKISRVLQAVEDLS